MKKYIFIILALFVLTPLFAGALFNEEKILISVMAREEGGFANWTKNVLMIYNQNTDFFIIIKNNSNDVFNNVNLEIKIPREILYNGHLTINGEEIKNNFKNQINIGVFLPAEQKIISFQAKSQYVGFKEKESEIWTRVSAGNFISSDSTKINLKPYAFQNIKTAKKIELASIGVFAKQWYFWIILIIILAFLFFKIFLKLFGAPMG